MGVMSRLGSAIRKAMPTVLRQDAVTGLFGQVPPVSGTSEVLSLYSRSPWLRAIVHKIGYSVAEVQWQLFVPGGKGKGVAKKGMAHLVGYERRRMVLREVAADRLNEIEDHPLLDFLSIGNDDLTGLAAMQVTQHYLDLIGEAFWLLERNGLGVPIKYWPIPPTWVKRFPTAENKTYGISPSGRVVNVPMIDVIFFRDPDPVNPYKRGVGTAKSLGDELEIDEYAARHTKAFFYNRARPDLIISGDSISRADSERLEQKWLQDFKGVWRAYKPLFFSRKIDVRELGQSLEELQMVQLRKHERDTFINVFAVPPEKLGVVSDSKRSTIQAADYFWTKDVIRPRVELLRATMQRWLVPQFDEKLLLDFDTPVVQDDELRLRKMEAAAWAYTINEWRADNGHESLGEAGDQLLVPLNSMLVPLKDAVGAIAAPGGSTQGGDGKAALKGAVGRLVAPALADIDKEIRASIRAALMEGGGSKIP